MKKMSSDGKKKLRIFVKFGTAVTRVTEIIGSRVKAHFTGEGEENFLDIFSKNFYPPRGYFWGNKDERGYAQRPLKLNFPPASKDAGGRLIIIINSLKILVNNTIYFIF